MKTNLFMLHAWGGFYNTEHREKHREVPGYRWFPTAAERQMEASRLEALEEIHQARRLMLAFRDGRQSRIRRKAVFVLSCEGQEYRCEEDFGFGLDDKRIRYMFNVGNYACDCNRMAFLHANHPDVFSEDRADHAVCGSDIKLVSLTIEKQELPADVNRVVDDR